MWLGEMCCLPLGPAMGGSAPRGAEGGAGAKPPTGCAAICRLPENGTHRLRDMVKEGCLKEEARWRFRILGGRGGSLPPGQCPRDYWRGC